MATLPEDEARARVAAVNQALSEGFPLNSTGGHGNKGALSVAAQRTGVAYQSFMRSLQTVKRVYGLEPDPGCYRAPPKPEPRNNPQIPKRLDLAFPNGRAIVFSDAHYWPGEPTAAHKALVQLIGELRPALVIANGDILDGARISRHERDGWAPELPPLVAELNACKERMSEIEGAAGLDAALVWCSGNHDDRYEKYLASHAPELDGMPGALLCEHFPRWTPTVSLMVNDGQPGQTMILHAHRMGVHAAYNNTLTAGINIVTGHLHRLTVTAWGDYRGRRYGVDTGTLAEPSGPQFFYAKDTPKAHGSGFAVLTWHDGVLAPPELVEVRDGVAWFRGEQVL